MAVTVEHSEDQGSPVESWGGELGFSAIRTLRCSYSDRHTLAGQLLDDDFGRGALYDPRPSTMARVLTVGIKPFAAKQEGSGRIASYDTALLTVPYGFNQGEDADLISESLEPTAEFLTLNFKEFQWDTEVKDKDKTLKEAEAPGRLVKGMDYVLTKYQQTGIPASVLTLPGSCNDAPITAETLGLTFDTETLLFNPPTLSRTINTSGNFFWTITYRFTFHPPGWNTFWRAKNHGYEPIYRTGIGEYINYPPASFVGIV